MLLGVLLFATHVFVWAATLDRWETYEINIGSAGVLRFSAPAGSGVEVPGQHYEKYVDIADESIFRQERSGPYYFEAFNRVWDFRGWFWEGVLGHLDMSVLIIKKQKSGQFGGVDDLKKEVERFADAKTSSILDEQWLAFRYLPRWGEVKAYTAVVDDQHYLMVKFRFIKNTEKKDMQWHRDAENQVSNIAASFHFEKKR